MYVEKYIYYLLFSMDAYVQRVSECAEWIRKWCDGHTVDVVIVCGSGLGDPIAGLLDDGHKKVPYYDIPHFPMSTVSGHAGRLLCGRIHGRSCLIMQGRPHYYEGHDMQDLVVPIRAVARLGVKTLLLTNACGSINLNIHSGDIVLINDHIAFPCLSGITPLRGANYPEGERFPGMTHLWSEPSMPENVPKIARACYGFISGPQFESPAEVRALRMLGVDVVGMSTVPEAIAAKHAGVQTIIGVGLVTNECIDSSTANPHEPSHKEVLLNSTISGERFARVIMHIVSQLPSTPI